MDDTALQPNQKKESPPAKGTATGAKGAPQRASRLVVFLLIAAACLAAFAVYGVLNRSASTAKLEQQANQAASEQTVSIAKPERLSAAVCSSDRRESG